MPEPTDPALARMQVAHESRLDGMTVVVTGASRGIGRAIALAMADGGANLVITARQDQAGLDAVAGELSARGTQVLSLLSDVGLASGHAALVQQAWQWQGTVEAWVNNAGADVLTGELAEASFQEKLDQLWHVDVRGTIGLSRLVGQAMRPRGGSILNMGWDQAAMGMAGDSGEMFAAAKGAVMAFSLSLARSLAPAVRVNCLAPGWIQTRWADGTSEYWQQRAVGESLLNRWGTPEDVGHLARFLVSPAGAFINAQTISLNGGAQPWPTSMNS